MSLPLLSLSLLAAPLLAPTQDPPVPDDTEIVTTASGLKYSVLKQGDGSDFPRYGDRVRVHYSGWLTDGVLFESSRQGGEPAEFAVGRVIEGWNEALPLMSPGARFKLTIPADLAYGERGSPPKIPAGATLIFDVELLAITGRTLPFVPWSEEGVSTTAGGLSYKTLAEGDGPACTSVDSVILDFAMYDDAGKALYSSPMVGAPLVHKPTQFEFLDETLSVLKRGSHVILRVPTAKMKRLRGMLLFDTQESFTWQLKVLDAYRFERPVFQLPPDEELTATGSGLEYKVLHEGSGQQPNARNTVKAHYFGWLTDGTPFDNSYDRGRPLEFPLSRVIAGWTEGLSLMKTGAEYLFVIPSDLGYGERGSPPNIPGGATLVFIVRLVDVPS